MFSPRNRYRLYEPPNTVAPLPVILFLHGAGEMGRDGVAQTTVGIGPAIRKNPERFPALVVFPQASHGYGWRERNLSEALSALDDVMRDHHVDEDRVYVTGISMGGYGAWAAALQQPERFAAVVPICGGLDPSAGFPLIEAAARLKHLPHWVFHGEADNIIPVLQSRMMVDALRLAGCDLRYTEYPRVKHNSWDPAYAEPELMPWLLAQRRAS